MVESAEVWAQLAEENSLIAGEEGPVAAVAEPNWTITGLDPAIFLT